MAALFSIILLCGVILTVARAKQFTAKHRPSEEAATGSPSADGFRELAPVQDFCSPASGSGGSWHPINQYPSPKKGLNDISPVGSRKPSANPAPRAAAPTAVRPDQIRRFCYETLNDAEKKIYDTIYKHVKAMETTFSVGFADPDVAMSLIAYVRYDHPELFWLNGGCSSMTRNFECRLTVGVYSNFSEARAMQARLDKKIDQILAAIGPCKTVYEKIIRIHDYIADHCVYNFDAYKYPNTNHDRYMKFPTAFNAYSCLVEGCAVCEGYAHAFQMLLHRIGVSCGFIGGDDHAWNYVLLGKDFYYVDVTYDDPTNENPGKRVNDRKTHKYCFVTSAEILRNHKIDPKMPFIPKCVATEYNYYVQTGLYLRRYSLEAVRQMLRTHFTPERFEFRCADRSVFEAAKKSLITNREAFKLLPGKKIAYDDVPGLNLIVLFFS